jgi:hypothetical protein
MKVGKANGPPPSAVEYKGPAKVVQKRDENMMITTFATVSQLSTTSASQMYQFNSVFTSADAINAAIFSNAFVYAYDEYRVVALTLRFVPKYENVPPLDSTGSQAANQSPLYLAVAHGNTTALTTETQAVNHMNSCSRSVTRPQSITVKMQETDEAQWLGTTTSPNTTGVLVAKVYLRGSTVGSTSTTYFGTLHEIFTVQFRGRTGASLALKRLPVADGEAKTPAAAAAQANVRDEVARVYGDDYVVVRQDDTRAGAFSALPPGVAGFGSVPAKVARK